MKETNLVLASIGAALGATVCCVGPFAAVVFGVGSLAAASSWEPLRPYFLAGTLLLFGGALYLRRRAASAACAGGVCPPGRSWSVPLWLAAGLILILIAFPYYAEPLSRYVLALF